MKKNLTHMLPLIGVSIIWFFIGWVVKSQLSNHTPVEQRSAPVLMNKAYELIKSRQYLTDEVTGEQFAYAAIRGMLAETQDPYAVLFAPPVSQAYALDIAGEVGVPGLWIERTNEKLVIVQIKPGQAAERAGLQVGDVLLSVNGVNVDKHTSLDEASILLRGPVGTSAKVVVQRNQTVAEYAVVREAWTIFTSKVISDQIGYIQQVFFPVNAEQAMHKHLQTLADQHVQAMIWDLRGSRGGSMQATQAILNNFMAEGLFYSAEFPSGERQLFSADGSAKLVDLPLVVLIDERTYSSSEMAAVALAEHQRAVLIGTPTEGKGMIQDTIGLDDQHLLRLTIAKWLSPTGQWIQGSGVMPTIEVVDDPMTVTDEVLDFAIQYLYREFLEK